MEQRAMQLSLIARWEALGRPLAKLPQGVAAALLALVLAAMIASAGAASAIDQAARARAATLDAAAARDGVSKDSGDIALYARIAARVSAGEDYYAAAMDEQRANNYPTKPFVAVRQPTLAWLQALIGVGGVRLIELGLMAVCLALTAVRLDPLVSRYERLAAIVLMTLGGAAVLVPMAGLLHELWAGLWLTTALFAYRPERWWPALVAALMAVAVRELAVPFVLLWLAFALGQRRWREAAAVAAALLAFAAGMGAHYLAVEAGRMASDPASQGWDGLAGYGLPLMALARLTGLLLLPVGIAAPIAILPLIGWAAIGGRLGLFALLWLAGMLTLMALVARPENFYWAQLMLPAYMVGLAFAPRGLFELLRAAIFGSARVT